MDALAGPFGPYTMECSCEPNRAGKPRWLSPVLREKPTPNGIGDARRFCGAERRQPKRLRASQVRSPCGKAERKAGLGPSEKPAFNAKPYFLVSGMVYNNLLPRPCAHYDL